MNSLKERIEQLEVQLAGCGAAALGYGEESCVPGSYGWSASYQDVVNLRKHYDGLTAGQDPADYKAMYSALKDTIADYAGYAGVDQGKTPADTVREFHATVGELAGQVQTLKRALECIIGIDCHLSNDALCWEDCAEPCEMQAIARKALQDHCE